MKRTWGFALLGATGLLLFSLTLWSLWAVPEEGGKTPIFLICDEASLAADPRIQAACEGLGAFTQPQGETYGVISVKAGEQDRLAGIDRCVQGGAGVILCLGEDYAPVVFAAQKTYPQVSFLLLDSEPHSPPEGVYETKSNTHCILFDQESQGFLAGYLAVGEGYRSLGFCGATPQTQPYGYGFLRGADWAAQSLGLAPGDVTLRYWYAGAEDTQETVKAQVSAWFQEGTQVVLSCDGGREALARGVVEGAVVSGGKVLGVDGDFSGDSLTVLCSVVKNYPLAVREALEAWESQGGLWTPAQAGATRLYTAAQGGIYPVTTPQAWRMQTVTPEACQWVVSALASGEIARDVGGNSQILPAAAYCRVEDLRGR